MASSEEGLERVRAEAGGLGTDPYLVTVTADDRPHCAVVAVEWDLDAGRLAARAPSSWPGSDSNGHRQVTLLWPPPEPGGYSLMVDGLVDRSASTDERLSIAPTRAVLHRPGLPVDPGSSCRSDCVPILSR